MKLQNRTDVYKLDLDIERIVFLGDPHGDVEALTRVLEVESAPNTVFVSVGDNIGYKSADDCSQLCHILKENNIPSVWGNHEHWSEDSGRLFMMQVPGSNRVISDSALVFCKSLPRRIKIESKYMPDVSIYVQHSIFNTNTQEWDWITPENAHKIAYADIVVAGHSHRVGLHVVSKHHSIKEIPVVSTGLSQRLVMSADINEKFKYVIDSGSISRADGEYPDFKRGTYSVLHLKEKKIELKKFVKKLEPNPEEQKSEVSNPSP